jgi:hypothetical protein
MSTYHEETAYQRDAMWGYALDWANQPSPFKSYQDRDPQPMPRPQAANSRFF